MKFFAGITIYEKFYIGLNLAIAVALIFLFSWLYIENIACSGTECSSNAFVASFAFIPVFLWAVFLAFTAPIAIIPDIWRIVTTHASPKGNPEMYIRLAIYLLAIFFALTLIIYSAGII